MVGRILVEMFRAAVNNKLTLVVEDVMQHVQLIIDDNGKSRSTTIIRQNKHFEMHKIISGSRTIA